MNHLKQILTLFACWGLLLVGIGSPVSVSAAIRYTQTFGDEEISTQLITAPNGQIYTSFYGHDMVGSGEPGQPEIPYKIVRFLVPDKATDFSVTVNSIDGVSTYPLAYPLYPVQQPISINDYSDELFTYSNDISYKTLTTTFKAMVLEEMRIEGKYHVISVGLWPWAWSGKDNRLEICNSIQITLDYKENSSTTKKEISGGSSGFVNIADIVVNAEDIPQMSTEYPEMTRGIGLDDVLPRYYIISERNLLPACEDLATWKTQKGYFVVRKAIEDIYADSRYKVGTNSIVDEAASLRKYLQDEFAEYGTFFCLLIGDHQTQMPIRKVFIPSKYGIRPCTTPFNGDDYIPTDAYFANLAEDKWNNFESYNDAFFIMSADISFDPYVYIGRLLCHSATEIYDYTSKLILYESNPGRGNSDYLNKSLVSMQYETFIHAYSETSNVISEMNKTFKSVDCLRDTVYTNANLTHCYPTGDLVLTKINHSGYISLNGHGEPSTIACSGYSPTASWEYIKALESYRGRDDNHPEIPHESNIAYQCNNCGLDLMTNYDSPSVIYTLACNTAPFDIFDTFNIPHTMASSFTCGGKYGGVGYLANTRSGYWPYSNVLELQFLKDVKQNTTIGIAEALSKVNYRSDSYVRTSHNLIGDPEFRLWLQSPSELNVSACWEDDFRISGYDASGCTVVQNDGEGNIRRKNISIITPTSPMGYPSSGKMQVLGIFKDGFLPQVKMDCRKDNLKDCNKKFVVRTAYIGVTEEKSVFIGSNAKVDIKAVDAISTGQGLTIENDGNLTLRCDKDIELVGTEVKPGGSLHLTAEKVVLSNGFSVKAGGSLSVKIH